MADDVLNQSTVQPSQSTVEGCPVIDRLEAYTITQGVTGSLEHVIKDSAGNPLDLTTLQSACSSDSSEPGEAPGCGIYLRAREATFILLSDQTYEVQASIIDAAAGRVRVELPADVADNAAIYALQWGVINTAGQLLYAEDSYLIVQPSLWASQAAMQRGIGPPTLKELRLTLKDSGPADNPLLRETAFSDEELLNSLIRPVKQFHETPPVISYYTTRNFPWREYWIKAVHLNLYDIAAAFYRRNNQRFGSNSGVSMDFRNKEREYLAAAEALRAEWIAFIQHQKVTAVAKRYTGRVGGIRG